MKIERVTAIHIARNLSLLDGSGASYTPDAAGLFADIDFYASPQLEENSSWRKKFLKKSGALLGLEPEKIPEEESQLSPEQWALFNRALEADASYKKFLAEKIDIPVEPVRREKLRGCVLYPSFLRPLNRLFILP